MLHPMPSTDTAPRTGDGAADEQPEASTRPRTPSRKRRVLIAVLGLLVTLLWSFLAILVLDASTWPHARDALVQHAFTPPIPMLASLAVVWVVVLLIVAAVGRLWLAMGIVSALTALLAIVNMTKTDLRGDPLFPTDVSFLSQPGFLFEMVPVTKVVLGLGGMVVLIVGSWLLGRLVGRFFPSVTRGLGSRALWTVRALRVVVVVVCLLLLHVATNFNEPGNMWRSAFDSQVARWRYWDQQVNYRKNGFVAGLLFNMHVTAMAKPKGYSKASVEAVVRKYTDLARQMNKGRTGSLAHTNIVVVLSESYTDPSWLKTVHYPQNPVPNTQRIMSKTLSGRMLAPGYGGGTANVEFETLTGESLSQFKPQMSIAYEQLVDNYDHYPSAVKWFEDRGHVPMAIHPFSPRMYSRTKVYKAFGFNRFITKDTISYRDKGGGRYIDDQSLFDEASSLIHKSTAPLFLNCISMQNHMPYDKQYDDPITPTGLPPQFTAAAGQYGRGIARTDAYLAQWLQKLKKEPEPTAVIFYGDHLPGEIYPPSLINREGKLTAHQTPFLIWSNKQALRPQKLPTTSPTQFLPKLFDATNTPIPAYYALLDSLDKQLPAMDAGLYVNSDDQVVPRGQLTTQQRQVLDDYRLIQYDMSIGKRYSENQMFGTPPTG